MSLQPRAPVGGCHIQGAFYEGGEFIPTADEPATPRPLSPRQIEAAEQRELRLANDRANSRHVGTIGERIAMNVTVAAVIAVDGFYGPMHITIARDQAGNVYVSKGARWGKSGDTPDVTATIKAFETRDGVAQTIIQRVKLRY